MSELGWSPAKARWFRNPSDPVSVNFFSTITFSGGGSGCEGGGCGEQKTQSVPAKQSAGVSSVFVGFGLF